MPISSQICSVDELIQRFDDPNIRVLDGSWYMPSAQRKPILEYQQQHISGARFFDIDAISDAQSQLPHMLPNANQFSCWVGKLGIGNRHEVIVYDTAGLFSAARVWWMFKVFGHDRVRVLGGGMPAWLKRGGATAASDTLIEPERFEATEPTRHVIDRSALLENCTKADYLVLDARSSDRFYGRAPEPRPNLASGHIPNSLSLPFDHVLEAGQLRPVAELRTLFDGLCDQPSTQFVTSCGSGVTAAILTLALVEADYGLHRLYDGAWAEWASLPDSPIETE